MSRSKGKKKPWLSEKFKILGIWSGESNPTKHPEIRARLSERMTRDNPTKRPEVRAKIGESLKGSNNPAKRLEIRAK